MVRRIFSSMEDFFSDNEARRWSEECDYGRHWAFRVGIGPRKRAALSYVADTGEVYLYDREGCGYGDGFIVVIAVLPPEKRPDITDIRGIHVTDAAWTLSGLLEGWGDECYKDSGINWVKQRLRDYLVDTEATVAD